MEYVKEVFEYLLMISGIVSPLFIYWLWDELKVNRNGVEANRLGLIKHSTIERDHMCDGTTNHKEVGNILSGIKERQGHLEEYLGIDYTVRVVEVPCDHSHEHEKIHSFKKKPKKKKNSKNKK